MLVNASSGRLLRGGTSLVGLLRQLLDPALIVLTMVASCVVAGVSFQAQELVLALLAFSLTFPGEVSLRRLKQNLFSSIVVNWVLVFALLAFFGYATRFLWYFDPKMLALWGVATPFILYGAHRIVPGIAPRLLAIDGYRSAVVVSANDIGRRLARNLNEEPTLGFRFSGFFSDRTDGAQPRPEEGPVLGAVADAADYVRTHGVEAVFIAMPMAAQPQVLRLLDELKDTTASIYFVPDIFIADLIQARLDDVGGVPIVAVCETPFVGLNALTKWVSDISIALLLLVVLAPLMLVIAAGVRASSPGPVIFRQRRYGLDGREIIVFKFRTMRVAEDGAVVVQAQRDDPRVTPLGRFLRRTSLDELPQLFNVLRGTMSVVGPRPHAVSHNEMYRRLIKGYMMRHKVKPGITGWAQVNGLRGETDDVEKMRARIEYDLDYLRRWSPGFDLLIVLKTAAVVWRRTNAY